MAKQKDASQRGGVTNSFGEVRVYSRATESEIGREGLRGPNDLRLALDRLLARNPYVRDSLSISFPAPAP